VSNLTLGIKHLAVALAQPLYAALASAPMIGFFDPFTLQLPPLLERHRHCHFIRL
jgi:hypothetical protein